MLRLSRCNRAAGYSFTQGRWAWLPPRTAPTGSRALRIRPRVSSDCALLNATQVPPLRFDFLRVFLIHSHQVSVCIAMNAQKLVEFGMKGLRVAVLRPLDYQGHPPRRESCDRLPVKCLPTENKPANHVDSE